MNTYIALSCLLALVATCHGSAVGLGGLGLGYGGLGSLGYGGLGYGYGLAAPIYAPAAVSTANLVKAAPIPIIRTAVAPIISAPVIKTVAVAAPVSLGYSVGLGGVGLGGYGLGGYGLGLGKGVGLGYGLGGYGLGLGKGVGVGYGLGGYGLGSYGLGGYGLGGYGLGGYGLGYGIGKH